MVWVSLPALLAPIIPVYSAMTNSLPSLTAPLWFVISLREKTSVRAIAKEISAAEQPPSVRIYAYRNGDGRQKEGQLIVGSSVIGVSW